MMMFGVTPRAKRTAALGIGYKPINILDKFELCRSRFFLAQSLKFFAQSDIFLLELGSCLTEFRELLLRFRRLSFLR